MYVYVYVHVCRYIYTYIHVCIRVNSHIYMYTTLCCVQANVCVCQRIHPHTLAHIHAHTHTDDGETQKSTSASRKNERPRAVCSYVSNRPRIVVLGLYVRAWGRCRRRPTSGCSSQPAATAARHELRIRRRPAIL